MRDKNLGKENGERIREVTIWPKFQTWETFLQERNYIEKRNGNNVKCFYRCYAYSGKHKDKLHKFTRFSKTIYMQKRFTRARVFRRLFRLLYYRTAFTKCLFDSVIVRVNRNLWQN